MALRIRYLIVCFALCFSWQINNELAAAGLAKLELRDGDRVAFIGGTFVEREQRYSFLETNLLSHHAGKNIVFRNLGWSGDTVWGEARAGFGTPADGFQQLKAGVERLQPTLILVAYGANEAFAGQAGLPKFVEGLELLLKAIEPTKARIALLSPLPQEKLPAPLPDPSHHNADMDLYRQAIAKVASDRGHGFIDLFELMAARRKRYPSANLTNNGVHLNALGYWVVGQVLAETLGAATVDECKIELSAKGGEARATGMKVSELKKAADGLSFTLVCDRLPLPTAAPWHEENALPERSFDLTAPGRGLNVAIADLPDGEYELSAGGATLYKSDAAGWAKGIILSSGPQFDQVEALRAEIAEKNQLYFYRWRPQNETYLFGFRQHEQGKNAREIPLFDPLVAERESKIRALSLPKPHNYVLKKAN